MLVASIFEVGWMYSLRRTEGFTRLLPMIPYAVCGFGSAFFLSRAMRQIPAGTAYAAWMGLAVAGGLAVEVLFLGVPLRPQRLACVLIILAGVLGLKLTSAG
jgi:quaternary ammonium compound-resistance protein SugE